MGVCFAKLSIKKRTYNMLKIYFLVIQRRKCLEVVLLKKTKKIQLYNLLD